MSSSKSRTKKMDEKRICDKISREYDSVNHTGILLCEGKMDSIDVALYSKVYPQFLVIPVGGYSDVIKMVPIIKELNHEIGVAGLIDRDANSKKEISQLKDERNVYCTKFPFIENVICAPEIIKIFCNWLDLDYKLTIKRIREQVLISLSKKLREALPVNIGIGREERIESVSFVIHKQNGEILDKTANEASILYVYKNKTIVGIVANALNLHGRPAYYKFVMEMLKEPTVSNDLVEAARAHLPIIKI